MQVKIADSRARSAPTDMLITNWREATNLPYRVASTIGEAIRMAREEVCYPVDK